MCAVLLHCAVSASSALDQLALRHDSEIARQEVRHQNKWHLLSRQHHTLRRNLRNVITVEQKKVSAALAAAGCTALCVCVSCDGVYSISNTLNSSVLEDKMRMHP